VMAGSACLTTPNAPYGAEGRNVLHGATADSGECGQ
jgi:hypothetical protein